MTYFIALLRILALPLTLGFAWFMGHRGARRDAALKDARETVRRIQTREEIEDAIEADVDLVARAKRIGLVRPE